MMTATYLQPYQESPWHQSKQELHSHLHEGGRNKARSHSALALPITGLLPLHKAYMQKMQEYEWCVSFL